MIVDAVKNPTPLARECFRQGWSLGAARPALPPVLPALPCSHLLGTAWSPWARICCAPKPCQEQGESQSRNGLGWKDLENHLIPHPLPQTGMPLPEQVAQSSSQPGLEGVLNHGIHFRRRGKVAGGAREM